MLLQATTKDFDVIQNLLQDYSDSIAQNSNLIAILIIITSADLAFALFRAYVDFRLKEKDKAIHSFTMKEKNRIDILENIYKRLNEISFENDSEILLEKVTSIERYVSNSQLYINKQYRKIIQGYLDYYKGVMTDPRKRNLETEFKYMGDFCRLFEK